MSTGRKEKISFVKKMLFHIDVARTWKKVMQIPEKRG